MKERSAVRFGVNIVSRSDKARQDGRSATKVEKGGTNRQVGKEDRGPTVINLLAFHQPDFIHNTIFVINITHEFRHISNDTLQSSQILVSNREKT